MLFRSLKCVVVAFLDRCLLLLLLDKPQPAPDRSSGANPQRSTIADLVIGCQNEDDAGNTGWRRRLTTNPPPSWLCICFQVLNGAAMDEDGTWEMRSDRQAPRPRKPLAGGREQCTTRETKIRRGYEVFCRTLKQRRPGMIADLKL